MTQDLLCLGGLLLGLSIIVVEDIRAFRIPDIATLPLIVGGILCAALQGAAGPAAAGALVGYVFMLAVEILYHRLRGRDGLGRGDAKLFAAAGAWVGWTGLPLVLLVAAASGLLAAVATGRRNSRIPFGPFLAAGLLVTLAADRIGLG